MGTLPCVACGARVFRAHSFDGVLLDEQPVPDGELTLIPCSTGEPTAVYGEPGETRYSRHACPETRLRLEEAAQKMADDDPEEATP